METSPPVRGYTATKDQLRARLRRIEGQVRGAQAVTFACETGINQPGHP